MISVLCFQNFKACFNFFQGWTYTASNNNHPMLCESFRHFRNDLAETLLWHFRNSEKELKEILAHVLNLENYTPGLLAVKVNGELPIGKCLLSYHALFYFTFQPIATSLSTGKCKLCTRPLIEAYENLRISYQRRNLSCSSMET